MDWFKTTWWVPLIDGPLFIGDALYGLGLALLSYTTVKAFTEEPQVKEK